MERDWSLEGEVCSRGQAEVKCPCRAARFCVHRIRAKGRAIHLVRPFVFLGYFMPHTLRPSKRKVNLSNVGQ